MIGSRLIRLIRTDSNALLLIAEKYFIVYMYHSFSIHSSVNGHLGCFHVPAVINSDALNPGLHVSLLILVSLECMPSSGITGWYGSCILSYLRNPTLFSIEAVPVCIPTNSVRAFPFLHILSSIYCYRL